MKRAITENKYRNWVMTWNADSEGGLPPSYHVEDYLKTRTELYVFQEECGDETGRVHLQGSFRTKVRKRHNTLLNEFEQVFGDAVKFLTLTRMCGSWNESYEYCTKTETRHGRVYQSAVLEEYKGKDIKILDDKESWFPWQRALGKKIFIQGSLTLAFADDREIIWIEDPSGCTGKSKFTKFLCSINNDIIKLPFGTASQLRSAVICAGKRKLYIVDIPRTLGGDDDINAFISAIEDIKNGFVVSSMYGKYQNIFMEPPHIIVFSNDKAPIQKMTKDRWTNYKINKKTLKLETKIIEDQHPGNGFDVVRPFYEDEDDYFRFADKEI